MQRSQSVSVGVYPFTISRCSIELAGVFESEAQRRRFDVLVAGKEEEIVDWMRSCASWRESGKFR
jgi:hypothetical protein